MTGINSTEEREVKLGRFVVDVHVHAQRHAAGAAVREAQRREPGRSEYAVLSRVMREIDAYDNSERLLYDMDCYGVDMCVLLPAFGMSNEINLQIVDRHPERFVAVCNARTYQQRVWRGEEEWTIEGVCAELDRLLATGRFVGIGEGSPYVPQPNDPTRPVSMQAAIGNMLAILEVAAKHRVPVQIHTGCTMGYEVRYSTGLGPLNFNPLWVHDLAASFPQVPIILNHGGIQGWWSEKLYEDCLHVAAAHANVYLETGLWWSELYERAIADPNIGAEKLLWGTDWGASIPFHYQPRRYPPVYAVQMPSQGLVRHQVDVWGWSLRELARLRVPQDELNLILGGNAARLYRLPVPHRRLFREPRTAPARPFPEAPKETTGAETRVDAAIGE